MNKEKLGNRINSLKSKEDFKDIKIILSRYKSLSDRVKELDLNYGNSIMFPNGTYIEVGSNLQSIKDTLNTIVEGYSFWKEVCFRIKSINLFGIIEKIVKLFK